LRPFSERLAKVVGQLTLLTFFGTLRRGRLE